jgi:hypothetical protein
MVFVIACQPCLIKAVLVMKVSLPCKSRDNMLPKKQVSSLFEKLYVLLQGLGK